VFIFPYSIFLSKFFLIAALATIIHKGQTMKSKSLDQFLSWLRHKKGQGFSVNLFSIRNLTSLTKTLLSACRRWTKIIFYACLGLISTLCLPVLSLESEPNLSPLQLTQRGQEFYEAGQLDRAVETWQQAADAYSAAGDNQGKTESLINTATVQQALGLYPQSCQSVLEAFEVEKLTCTQLQEEAEPLERQLSSFTPANTQPEPQKQFMTILGPIANQSNSLNKTTGLLRLGDYFRATGYPEVAEEVLSLSLETAESLDLSEEKTAALLSLGNTARIIANRQQSQFAPTTVALDVIVNQQSSTQGAFAPYKPAINYYQQAAQIAPYPMDRVRAQLNQLSLLLDIWEFWQQANSELINNLDQIGISDPSFLQQVRDGALDLTVNLTKDLQPQIVALSGAIEPQLASLPVNLTVVHSKINYAQSLMRQGLTDSNTAKILAQAMAEARQIKNKPAEAEAIGHLGYLYEQKSQLTEARQLTEEALQLAPANQYPEVAYRWHRQLGRILEQQGQRSGALAAYETSFNTIKALRSDLATTPVEPIYREYVTLLLESEPNQTQLNKARDVLESLQVAELDNFFRDPCSQVAEEPVIIDEVDKQAAVIYPIILPNSLEVIVSIPEQDLYRYSTPISRSEVENTIRQLRRQALTNPGFAEELRGARGNPQQEQQLQRSLQESLAQNILPLSQEVYSWLIQPAEAKLQKNKIKTLVFVLDGPLRNIPMALLYDGQQYLIEKDYNVALTSGLQLTAPQPLKRKPIKVLAAGVTREVPRFDFPPIPKVEQELNRIKEIFVDSEVLLNDQFTQTNLQQKLKESDFPVVHLATHGQFSSTSDQTFIVSGDQTGNELINVNQLDNLLRVGSLSRSTPIELLVLSACNTAEGDNKAILGLAGVAVRAGARSTLATLWGANDEATANLMGYFYQNLAANTEVSKAQALREAQLNLLRASDSEYSHPYYWAPFVLVGNWL
jgi:CHAT domain-containing protein